MNCSDVIRERRSIRKYKEQVTIPQEDFEKMLEAAMMAPSARNTRPWEFFVITNRDTMARLQEAHPGSPGRKMRTLLAAGLRCSH